MQSVPKGDTGQLDPLFKRHYSPLFDFFCRMTGSRTLSEDLVQEVFFRILKYRETYRPGARFITWMYQIARNVRIDHFKSSRVASKFHLRKRPVLQRAEPVRWSMRWTCGSARNSFVRRC
jgi:RNA polymerase sigma factor (sigma-70 family)